ncbi:hypothetical protein [Halopiger xanaduensis]|uniref:Uncharacterized protein n=1 Tax=Halopiger xanaduensis (strain DSM 18323 / JCM 14033 / SH-6) TaxID=797210 RepID=F8DCL0_HALXS|nr:hypothetical protein [Halopiger xanaduensis]AEH36053.1 hypothetical protein Halxa_1420 [Halopiger xanaduensis SH-6]
MNRRTVLAATGAVGLGSLAGCLSDVIGSQGHDYERGTIDVTVNGEPIDLEAPRFQAENADNSSMDFHLHEGHEHWYMEGDRVTFAEGIDLLPHFAYEQMDGAHVVTIDGTVYDGRDDETDIAFTVNGDEVDPTETEIHDGDSLQLEVTTDEASDD